MYKSKKITYIALIGFILAVILGGTPLKLKAQDDDSFTPSSNVAPPVILDESDSGSVTDTEEYDG